MKKQEDFKNRALSMLLKELGVDCDYEQRIGRKRLDIVANVDGLRVILEAETGYHKRAQAIKDADARLRQKLTIAAIALCYPENVTEENMGELPLRWTLRTKAGDPAAQWSTGSVAQLAQTLRQVPNVLDDADVAARLLSDGLDSVVQRLRTPTRRALARALDLPAAKSKGGQVANGWFVAAKRGMLVVATAMLFHHRVQNHLPRECPDNHSRTLATRQPSGLCQQRCTHSGLQRSLAGHPCRGLSARVRDRPCRPGGSLLRPRYGPGSEKSG